MFLLLCVYLSEQNKLGKLPGQHKAHIGDAQSNHGRSARVPRPGEKTDTKDTGKKKDNRAVWLWVGEDKRQCWGCLIKFNIQSHSKCSTQIQLCTEENKRGFILCNTAV